MRLAERFRARAEIGGPDLEYSLFPEGAEVVDEDHPAQLLPRLGSSGPGFKKDLNVRRSESGLRQQMPGHPSLVAAPPLSGPMRSRAGKAELSSRVGLRPFSNPTGSKAPTDMDTITDGSPGIPAGSISSFQH